MCFFNNLKSKLINELFDKENIIGESCWSLGDETGLLKYLFNDLVSIKIISALKRYKA